MRYLRTHEHHHSHKEPAAELAAALLSLDEETIKLCARCWGQTLPLDEHTFWLVVHKARTGLRCLPEAERRNSQTWLEARGYFSLEPPD